MLYDELKKRKLPPLLAKDEMLSLLQENVYGKIPPKPEKLSFSVEENVTRRFLAGKGLHHRVTCTSLVNGKEFSFPFSAILPKAEGKHPFFVLINFRPNVPDLYLPAEELVDEGFAVLSFDYNDVTKDNGDFSDGLAGVLFGEGQREANDPGKIALWTWAAMRVMDYAVTLDCLDQECACICGHSRLGKTALLTGALDERFAFAYSNDSGCTGAALTRGKKGELVSDITERFPYWFCPRYLEFVGKEDLLPLDQHYLLASIAPRRVLVGSADEDAWADPISEQLACLAASEAFERGIDCDRPAKTGEAFLAGDIAYHLRKGKHYFSRQDWHRLMEYVRFHK